MNIDDNFSCFESYSEIEILSDKPNKNQINRNIGEIMKNMNSQTKNLSDLKSFQFIDQQYNNKASERL